MADSIPEPEPEPEPESEPEGAVGPEGVRLGGSGVVMPLVGLGTSFYPEDLPVDGRPEKGTAAYASAAHVQTVAAVRHALEIGYRLIDTSNGYCNQRAVGEALHSMLSPVGSIPRSQVCLVCKLSAKNLKTSATVELGVTNMLQRLHVSYVDVLMASTAVTNASWAAMEAAVLAGKARTLGLSNFDRKSGLARLKSLLVTSKVAPTVSQFEVHPFQINADAVAQSRALGLHIMAFSPLGAPHKMQRAGLEFQLLQHKTVQHIAQELNVQPADVLLGWGLQQGLTVIPKSWNRAHLEDNISSCSRTPQLTPSQMKALTSLNRDMRCLSYYRAGDSKHRMLCRVM